MFVVSREAFRHRQGQAQRPPGAIRAGQLNECCFHCHRLSGLDAGDPQRKDVRRLASDERRLFAVALGLAVVLFRLGAWLQYRLDLDVPKPDADARDRSVTRQRETIRGFNDATALLSGVPEHVDDLHAGHRAGDLTADLDMAERHEGHPCAFVAEHLQHGHATVGRV